MCNTPEELPMSAEAFERKYPGMVSAMEVAARRALATAQASDKPSGLTKKERKKLKSFLFQLVEDRRVNGGCAEHDPTGDETVLRAVELLTRMS